MASPAPPLTPSRLSIVVQPSSAQAGAAIGPALAVAVLDSTGTVVTTSTVAVRVRIVSGTGTSGAHLRGITNVAADSGVATFSTINLDSAGVGYRLVASAPGLPDIVSVPFDIVPAPAVRLAFVVQPSGTLALATVNPVVRVVLLDGLGNLVSSSSAAITVAIDSNPVAGLLAGTTVRGAVNGVATFTDLSINKSGDRYRLRATSPGLPAVSSVPFGVFRPVSTITTSGSNTCVLTPAGAALCGSSGVPAPVLGGLTFTAIGVEYNSACGLTAAGAAYCWFIGAPPSLVSSSLTFTALAVGSAHACGLTASGTAYCWGGDFYGQLGNGTHVGQNTPDSVRGGLAFSSISAGDYHTCGITVGGTTYCWGRNGNGQLGNGSTADTSLPLPVSGGLAFTALSAGQSGTCAQTANSTTYCWGGFAAGRLGGGAQSAIPFAQNPGPGLIVITTGGGHTCGLTGAGSAFCWGDTQFGELGNGPNSYLFVPSPVAVSGGFTFATIMASGGRTCGVTTGGEAYCWGNYPTALLGGFTTDTSVPQPLRIF